MDFDGCCKTKKTSCWPLRHSLETASWDFMIFVVNNPKISQDISPSDATMAWWFWCLMISGSLTFWHSRRFFIACLKCWYDIWGAQTSSDSRSWATLNSPGMTPKIAQNQAFRLPIDAPFSWVSWSWLAANTVKRIQPLSFTSKSTNSNSVLTSTVGPWRPLDTLLMPPPKKENLFSQHDTHCLVAKRSEDGHDSVSVVHLSSVVWVTPQHMSLSPDWTTDFQTDLCFPPEKYWRDKWG